MRILITGASGQLGAYLIDEAILRGHEPIGWSGSAAEIRSGIPLAPIDLTEADLVEAALANVDPDLIVHAAAVSSAEAVRIEPDRGHRVNVEATRTLAAWAETRGRPFVFTSTDLVFDGSTPWNREEDPARPLLAYGRTKREAEAAILATGGGLVARLPLLYGPSKSGRKDFFSKAIDAMRAGEARPFFVDEFRTPLDFGSAARFLIRLGEIGATGLVHVAGAERMSRFELMSRSATALRLDPSLVLEGRSSDVKWPEPRPLDVSLATDRLVDLVPDVERPTVEVALRTPV